jgi:type I restriction enzyme S subunit
MDAFLSQQIPLPSLEEQRTIIQEHLNKNKQAEYVEEEVDEVVKETRKWLMNNLGISINNEIKSHYKLQFIRYKSLEKWSISEIQRYDKYSYEEAKYKVAKIGDIILSFEGGKTPSTKCKEYWGEDVYWVSAKDMKELYLSNIQDKLSQKGVEDTKLKVYPQGTILGVFRSGILRHSFPVCITTHPVTINQDLKAFGIDERKVNKLYFLFYLNLLQDIVLSVAMKKGVTVESINTDAFMEIPFVCPPIEKQNEIVAHITALLDEQKNLRQQATELRQQAQQQFEQTIFN